MSYKILDPQDRFMKNPDTFELPLTDDIGEGDIVKLIFNDGAHPAERMWVIVKSRNGDKFTGVLDNEPYELEGINCGDPLEFEAKHIIQIYRGENQDFFKNLE